MGAPLTCLSARRVPAAGGVRSFADVPARPEREAVAVSSKVAAAEVAVANAARAVSARASVDGVAVEIGKKGWKNAACLLGAAAEVSKYEKAKYERVLAVQDAQRLAREAYHLRVYKEGQLVTLARQGTVGADACDTRVGGTN